MKPCLVIDEDATYYLKDRMSALIDLIDEDASQFRLYLAAMNRVLPHANSDNFYDLYLKELFPGMIEEEDKDKIRNHSTNPEGHTEEEREALQISSIEREERSLKTQDATSFARMILKNNEIKIGEPVDSRLDDPVLLLLVSPEKFESTPVQLKGDIGFYLDKSVALYVDEFTTPLAGDLDDEFWEEYLSEAKGLKALGLLIEKLATAPSSSKMDFSQFAEECVLDLSEENSSLNVDGFEVAEELARVLEKSGVIKRKGDKIKWKNNRD
jgi:hypothetical protein